MLVTKGDRLPLAAAAGFQKRFYSTLAGFMEPGETCEEAVIREVREEVGIEVGNIRYYASQPWPFPSQVMLGFFAEWKSGELKLDPEEIEDGLVRCHSDAADTLDSLYIWKIDIAFHGAPADVMDFIFGIAEFLLQFHHLTWGLLVAVAGVLPYSVSVVRRKRVALRRALSMNGLSYMRMRCARSLMTLWS